MHRWMSMLNNIGFPQSFHLTYIVEILILTVIIYELLIWVKNTRAWTLLKGIVVVTAFALISYFFHLTTLTWLMSKTAGVLVTVVVIVFQPELRRALEQLGRKNIIFSIFGTSAVIAEEDRRSRDKINSEIVKAVFEMSKVKTGALIVMEKKVILNEYERTGIPIDALISSQLLMNIFEHNTPLHDGAVFIRNQRVVAATCYLPLSDNMELSKELGTRHRAGVGISEVSDSLTIIVSEETGAVSIAESGKLTRSVSPDDLKAKLAEITQGVDEGKRKKLRERIKNERKTDA
ncbi:diadenylate cyclase CdaA [Coprococcus catus]|uniref:diadenylate cyclase CdaA n=1 Tax=Coprococcus catus TaxID=116085 RepID=UPI001C8C2FC5|nr:diadenylate cyclase CdaA [Coprococcus catus]MBX9232461.1 TIGR00159 family protein [Coprococcus catus]MCT6799360.1 TIGR00159 family protein [Coprococcus catus]